jgi:hypothetical protein
MQKMPADRLAEVVIESYTVKCGTKGRLFFHGRALSSKSGIQIAQTCVEGKQWFGSLQRLLVRFVMVRAELAGKAC